MEVGRCLVISLIEASEEIRRLRLMIREGTVSVLFDPVIVVPPGTVVPPGGGSG